MMSHPASDISKVLRSKRNLKTKKNFQFKFNNIRRKNGSVGTILSAEENIFPSFSKKVKENCHKTEKQTLKPCSVHLTRLSQIDLVSSGYKTFSKFDHKVKRNIRLNRHCGTKAEMRKHVNKAMKTSVDKTQLHLELEKAASTFASEVKESNGFPFEDYFGTPQKFTLTSKEKTSKSKVALKTEKREQTNVLKLKAENTTHRNKWKKQTGKKSKASSEQSASQNLEVSGCDSDEGEWLGWNSKVTPLDIFPGAEIVSVQENNHVENIINWNMKVESESDMDVEEVFLLTDLEELKHKSESTEKAIESSDEGWHGWPERKPSTGLCYVFNV